MWSKWNPLVILAMPLVYTVFGIVGIRDWYFKFSRELRKFDEQRRAERS